MSEFSDFLYELRKEKNLTQSELAEKLGITNKAVSKWETGDAMPDTAQLLPLAEILGVSVDELLRGERNGEKEPAPSAPPEKEDSIRFTDGENTVDLTADGHVFINGKQAERRKKSVPELVSGCICASLMAVSILTYILLGCFLELWHPLWCIPASAALGCGIVGCTCDLFDREKLARKTKKGENPYAGCACGIIMCASIIVFLCVASVLNLWNIMWVVPVAGVCACIIVGTIGGIFSHRKEK